jgi:hypothetical protein
MPITPYLTDEATFDPERKRKMGVAFELACLALKLAPDDARSKAIIAGKIIEIAQGGDISADALCERALIALYGHDSALEPNEMETAAILEILIPVDRS